MSRKKRSIWIESTAILLFFSFSSSKIFSFPAKTDGDLSFGSLGYLHIIYILNINIQYYFQKINHISNETQEKRVIPLFFVHLCVQIYAEHEFIIVKSQRKMIVWKDFVFIFKKNIWKNSDDSRKFANSIIESSEMQPLPLFCPVTADYLLYHDRILEFLFPLHSCFISSMI